MLLDFQFPRALNEPLLRFRREPFLARNVIRIPPERICFGHAIKQIEFTLSRQTAKGAIANLLALLEKFTGL